MTRNTRPAGSSGMKLWPFKKQFAMKKLFYYSIALLAAVSCAKEIAPQDNVEAPKGDLKTFTIGAAIDNSTIAPQAIASQELTKANLDAETLAVLWQAKDTIGLVTAEGTITPAWLADGYDGKAEGVFNYSAEEELEVVYAYYPYTSKSEVCQQSVEGGKLNISLPYKQFRTKVGLIYKNMLIMTAKADGESIVFKNTCAIAKVSVKGNPVLTRNFYVQTPEAALNGAGSVDMTSDNPIFVTPAIDEVSSANNKFATRWTVVDMDDHGQTITPGADYVFAGYVVMPAGTYHSLSFELLSTVGENTQFIQSYSPVKDITLNVGKIRPLNITVDVPAEFTDLSADGKIANCYMIQDEPGENFGFSLYTRAYASGTATNTALNLNGAYNATVLWQSTPGLISSVTYHRANRMIYFKRDTQKTGNAVITLRNREGQVIYSWHIWVVGETVGTNTFSSTVEGESPSVFMDRNIGATTKTGATATGLHYQYGRKDPFPSADPSNYTSGTNQNSVAVYPDVVKTHVAQDGVSADWVKHHPNVYVWGSSAANAEDWLKDQGSNLWGDGADAIKTVNDPCPYGWMVPTKKAYRNSEWWNNMLSSGSGVMTVGVGATCKDSNGDIANYPFSGRWRRTIGDTDLANAGTYCYLWTSTESGSLNTNYLGTWHIRVRNNNGSLSRGEETNQPRRWGSNVRCVKFTEVDATAATE